MNHSKHIGSALLMLLFCMMLSPSGTIARNNMIKISIEPSEFDVRHLLAKEGDPTPSAPMPEFILDPAEMLIFPDFPRSTLKNDRIIPAFGVNVNLPHKITIETSSKALKDFSWRKVQIPVIIAPRFDPSMREKGLSMSFMNKSSQQEVSKVPVNPDAWRKSSPLTKDILEDPESRYQKVIDKSYGRSDYWNMTYFAEFPRCSVSYDFWVTVRGVDSEHKPFEIVFIVDGQKITPANFEKMAEKYPALKEKDQNRWPAADYQVIPFL